MSRSTTLPEVLVTDHDLDARERVVALLEGAGYRATPAGDGLEALAIAAERGVDLLIADLGIPGMDGFELLGELRRASPGIHAILVSERESIEQAVAATRAKAVYLTKPLDRDELLAAVGRFAHRLRGRAELRAERDAGGAEPFALVGRSPAMSRLKHALRIIANSEGAVLICGESGTGKELVARRLHAMSERRNAPLVTVNCAAFPDTLLDSELFGHERGAFTGAASRRPGRFEAADGGTLFLDEIGEMPLTAQAKLLRVLEHGTFQRLGSNATIRADVRVISATNRDLGAMVEAGAFREDLLYRVKVFRIDVPPLEDRRGDLGLLVEYFCQKYLPSGAPPAVFSPGVWAILTAHRFRGNVRELEHAIRHAIAFAEGDEIRVEHLPSELLGDAFDDAGRAHAVAGEQNVVPLTSALTQFEYEYLMQTLKRTRGNRSRAASLLGISRKSLWAKLKRHRSAPRQLVPVRS